MDWSVIEVNVDGVDYAVDLSDNTAAVGTPHLSCEKVLTIPPILNIERGSFTVDYIQMLAFRDGGHRVEHIQLPESIEAIGDSAFYHCDKLKRIDMPKNMSGGIGPAAFICCDSLESITIPEGVEVIRDRTFWNCTSLTSVTLPSTLRVIEKDVFVGCISLNYLDIPESVEEVQEGAFQEHYNNLKEVVLHNRNVNPKVFAGAKVVYMDTPGRKVFKVR